MYIINIIISILILIVTGFLAVYIPKHSKEHLKIKPIYVIIVGVFLATFCMMLYVDFQPKKHGADTTLFLAIFHTIQILLAGYDFSQLYDIFPITNSTFFTPYFYISGLFVLAPICTFSFVLSFFQSITSFIRYLLSWKKDLYIMTTLSEKSISLANSIKKQFPKAAIIFMNVFSDDEETYTLINEASKINSIVFKYDLDELKLNLHSKKTKITFFAIDNNESKNIETALSTIENYRTRKNTELYVFSTSNEGELLLDSIEDGLMKVRRINESRAMAYSIINNKDDLITNYSKVIDGKKIISLLIIGFGGYGREITKAILWCAQLPEYDLEIHIIDKDINTESKFEAICPEIMALNHNKTPGEAVYSLEFHNGIDVNTSKFNNVVSSLKNTSLVFVSLGNDELNIETAIQTRILLERVGCIPSIKAIIHSELKENILKTRGLINFKNQNYQIETIGTIKERISYENIVNDKLEQLALKHHLLWADTPEKIEEDTKKFNEIEYFRKSSSASAIYDLYRTSENMPVELFEIYEHIRWNAYMRTEGYIFSGSYDAKTRNDRAKMHHSLVPQKMLNQDDIDKDTRMAKAGNN